MISGNYYVKCISVQHDSSHIHHRKTFAFWGGRSLTPTDIKIVFQWSSFKQRRPPNFHRNLRNQHVEGKKALSMRNNHSADKTQKDSGVFCWAAVNRLPSKIFFKSWSTCGLGSLTFFEVQHIVGMYVRDLFCPFLVIGPCLNEHFS